MDIRIGNPMFWASMAPMARAASRGLQALSALAAAAAICAGCGHGAAPAPAATPAASVEPAPGAHPSERNHLIEASWQEVRVKARKDGSEVTSAVKLVRPEIRLFHAGSPPAGKESKPDGDRPPPEVIDLAETLRKITPLEVDHIDILDGQLAFVDVSRAERPELWLHELQLSVENLTTRVHMGEGRPVLLTASGTLARSGLLTVFITADPFEKGLTFSGRAAVIGLETSELYRFIQPATKMQMPHGTIDIFVEFDCRNGELTGGVKPVLKKVEIRPTDKNPFTVLKAWAADLALKIFSDRVQDRNAVATVIPIKGTLTGPDVQLWPTIFGVMRNAFVEGLTSGYAYLPPITAPAKQSVPKQAVDSLAGSAPPKAQPTRPNDPAPTAPASPPSPSSSSGASK
jgi:hypothetical protein